MTSSTTCTTARNWFSADRDGEAGPDPDASAHLDACADCAHWVAAFDHVTRQVRLRAPMAPASVTDAVARIASKPLPVRHDSLGRVLLAVAAISGLVILIASATGIFGHSHLGSTEGREAEAITIALLGGFALAAWRPARLAAGLLPVAVLAAMITLSLSVIEVASGAVPVVDEFSHLPLLIGAIGAAIASRTSPATPTFSLPRATRPTPITHGV